MESNRQAILFSFLAGLFAVFLVYTYVNQKEVAMMKTFGDKVQVLVVTKDFAEMDTLTSDSLTVREIPKQFKQPDALLANEKQDLFENGVSPVAATPLRAGEQLQWSKVIYDDPRESLAKKVSAGKRAISVPVNDQFGVGRLVKPGDKVDVLSPVRYVDKDVDKIMIKTVLQNVLVLATGEQINNVVPRRVDQDPYTGRLRSKSLLGNKNYTTVTLEVEPRDAQKVAYLATQGGTVYLTLRNPVDDDVADRLSTTTSEEVLGASSEDIRDKRYRLSAPPKSRPPPRRRAPSRERSSSKPKRRSL